MFYIVCCSLIVAFVLPPTIMDLRKASKARKAEKARQREEAEKAEAKAKRDHAAAQEAERREQEYKRRQQEQERRRNDKLEAARLLAEYKERALQAERELKAISCQPAAVKDAAVKGASEPETQRPEPKRPETISPVVHSFPFKGNNAFAGQRVAFTGKLEGMTYDQAIKAVEENGGKGYHDMPAGTTMLVVGKDPGMGKMGKADQHIGSVRKITEQQFKAMLNQSFVDLTPDEFAKYFAAIA